MKTALCVLASCLTAAVSPAAHPARPNLIFILSDDLAQGDVGCYGQKLIRTPRLDRMAREGTRYTQAYSGTTVCAPSRASLITGLHAGRSPIRANREIRPEGQMPLPAGTFTVANLLKSAGYATAAVGKWGMGMFDTTGSPLKNGFDHFFGYNCQRHAHSYFPTYLYNDDRRFDLPGNDGSTKVEAKGAIYAQNLIAEEALRWVRAQEEGPFFLFYAITLPHGAFQIDDQGIYRDKPWTGQQKNYAAMVTRLDSDLGRLLDLLVEQGIEKNTLVMFSGDNGSSFDPKSEIGRLFDQTMGGKLRGFKRTMYEGGLRQAALAWWPGTVPAGRVSDEPWAFWDYLPTVAELTGAKPPPDFHPSGHSLVSYLKGGAAPRRDYFYWELHEMSSGSIQAARWDDWKAVKNGPSQPIEIYDLGGDAGETTDLASSRTDLVAKADALMKSARTEDPNWPMRDKPLRKPRKPARPNILWLTAEDLSPNLRCYGDAYARTPNLDAFAQQALRYTRAFATAPVCSPARSCLITGMYATSLGTQRLRSQFPVPKDVRAFSARLRDAGYYCSNNVKTDYNLRNEKAFVADAWDESSASAHWRKRPPGRPFFAVFNFMTTHQSRTSVWPQEQFEREIGAKLAAGERHDPAAANLPPYYPDTAEARRAWARYHDCATLMDRQVGEMLRQLEQDALDDDTIVFFYGDHGMGMPRGKRVLQDSGLRVPLIIRFPEKWRHLAPADPGSAVDRLVSFVDFAPTVLSLCGVKIPGRMQGSAFLGPAAGQPREYVYGARDRVDEVFDLSRSVRDARWLYIRNFMPHLSWMPPERYSDNSTFRRELKRLAAAGQLGPDQLTYAAPRRAVEELYQTSADPHQLHNLAASPDHTAVLKRMRNALWKWLRESRDAGFLTEPQMWQRIGEGGAPLELARDPRRYPLAQLLDAAHLVGRPEAWPQQLKLLEGEDDGVRYWAAVGLSAAERRPAPVLEALRKALSDPSPVVRIEAASALASGGEVERSLPVLAEGLTSDVPEAALHAARAIELLGPTARPLRPTMRQVLQRAQKAGRGSEMTMFIRFSLEAALEMIAE